MKWILLCVVLFAGCKVSGSLGVDGSLNNRHTRSRRPDLQVSTRIYFEPK